MTTNMTSDVDGLQSAERRAFIAISASFVASGVHVAIGLTAIHWILKARHRHPRYKVYLAYISLLLTLGILNISLWGANMSLATILAFDPATTPTQVPRAYIAQGAGASAAALAINALCDGLLLYRCYIVWGSQKRVIVLPILLYLSALAWGFLDVIVFWNLASRQGFLPVPLVHLATKVYWALVISLNGLLTSLIVLRILWMRRRLSHHLAGEYGRIYAGIIAYLVESFAVYSIAALLGFAFNWWIFKPLVELPQSTFLIIALEASPFNPFLVQTECIASEWIILRVALGRAWTDKTTRFSDRDSKPSTIRFSSPSSESNRLPMYRRRRTAPASAWEGSTTVVEISRKAPIEKDSVG